MPPQTRYTQSGAASIAYQVFGTGPPLVMAPLVPSHLDLMWIDPAYTQILRRLGSFARVVIFDPRGLGLSDPLDHVPTLEETADAPVMLNDVRPGPHRDRHPLSDARGDA
jgi:pimeloyl-ACP methyl ester carboxylesterase